MQEIHSIGGGRFFDGGGGGAGGGEKRPHHHQNQQALKCPRCDSLNTKFCYYNNYNLSQPRHFCKSCRRYWTKGGVLRNVPVGGGCRKSKRSEPKASPSSEPHPKPTRAPAPPPPPPQENHKSSSHSSSESSSLAAAAAAAATEALSAPSSSNRELLTNQTSKPNLESGLMEKGGDCGIFSEIGSFTSLITTTSEALSFEFGNIPDPTSFRFGGTPQLEGMAGNELLSGEWQQAQRKETGMGDMISQQELKLPEIIPGTLLDPTVPLDLSALQSKNENGGFGSLDWQGVTDQGLFDLPNTVDHSYWSHTHWTDQENPSLFHLP